MCMGCNDYLRRQSMNNGVSRLPPLPPSSLTSFTLWKPNFFFILSFDIIHCIRLYLHCDLLQFVMFVRRSMNSMLRSLKYNWTTCVWKAFVGCFTFSRIVFFFYLFRWRILGWALYSFDGMFLSHQNRNRRFFFFIFCYLYVNGVALNRLEKNSATVNM